MIGLVRILGIAIVFSTACSVAFATEFTADFALQVCDTWRSDHDGAIALLTANGWSDAGTQQKPFESEPELQLGFRLHDSRLHPAPPAQSVVPVVILEEATFGNLRITSCEAYLSTDGAPFMSLEQSEQWLRSKGFNASDEESGPSLGMVIFRASRTGRDGDLTWATVGTWHVQAFPNSKYWRIRFHSATSLRG